MMREQMIKPATEKRVQVVREVVNPNALSIAAIYPGYGRIYDDIWPRNIAGLYCTDSTLALKPYLDQLYPDGWEANSHLLLITLYPHLGPWHRDAPPYEEDTIVMLCVIGFDELEYAVHESASVQANLCPGDLCLLPASTYHRGRCSTTRLTYHCRVGPKGKIMPESPMDKLPPMTIRRFLGRTWRTLKYWLR